MKPSNELIKRIPQPAELERPNEFTTPNSYNYGVDPNAETEVHLLDYWRAVRKRMWLVVSVVVLVTTLAVLFVARKPDIYQANSRVQVDLENSAALLGKAPYVFGQTNDPVYFNTQLQILVSPGLMRRVVKSLDLEHNPDFFKGNSTQKRSTWQTVKEMGGFGNKNAAPNIAPPKDQLPLRTQVAEASAKEDLIEAKRLGPYVGAILSGLKVDPVKESRGLYKETRLIDITFTHGDPEVASKVVNAIAETYVANNVEKRSDTNVSTADFLQKRIAELQENIRTDEERLLNYARNNRIISLDASQNTVVERLAGLNRQLLEAEAARIDAAVTQAGELAELIRSRPGTPSQPPSLSYEEWRQLRAWAVRRTTAARRGNYTTVGIGWRLFAASVTANFAWMFSGVGLWAGILIAAALTAGLLADWWRVRNRMRVAEHNVLPPASPDWGEIRADHAPIPGWQSWR